MFSHVFLDCTVVRWKKPPGTSDEVSYQDSWLVAENLDHNSLAAAFRMFPVSADPVYTRHQLLSSQSGVVGKDELSSLSCLEFSDSEEEEEEEGSCYEEEEEVEVSSEVTRGGDECERDAVKDFNVSNLRDSGELA